MFRAERRNGTRDRKSATMEIQFSFSVTSTFTDDQPATAFKTGTENVVFQIEFFRTRPIPTRDRFRQNVQA